AGAGGDAVSLVCVDERKLLTDVERLIKRELPSKVIAGFEPDPRIRAEPIVNGSGGGQRPARSGPAGLSGVSGRGQQRNQPGAKPQVARISVGRPAGGRAPALHRSGGRGR